MKSKITLFFAYLFCLSIGACGVKSDPVPYVHAYSDGMETPKKDVPQGADAASVPGGPGK